MYLRSPRWTHPITGVAAYLSRAIVLWYRGPLPADHQTHEDYTQPSNCTGKGPAGTASVLRINVFRRRSRRGWRKGENEGTAIRPATCYIVDTGCGYCAGEDGENTQIKQWVILSSCLRLSHLSVPSFHPPIHTTSSLTLPPSHPCIAHRLYTFIYPIACNQILYLPIFNFNNQTIELYLPLHIYCIKISPFYSH